MAPSASGCETEASTSRSRGSATYISAPFHGAWEINGEMCGIIGVAGIPDAARVTYLGLYSLQHRGQESAGVVAVDGAGVARAHRGMGLVSDVFNETVIAGLPGDVAIGHTRYSTAGTSVIANAQPILAGYHEGPLALAHNGNLTNAQALRADLVAKGSIFQTSSDSEVLIHLIARSEAREPEDQLLDALERVEGAYSLVVTIGRTLYAIVDPRGFRPLWLGKLGQGYVVASETCAPDLMGATPVREAQPRGFLRSQGAAPPGGGIPRDSRVPARGRGVAAAAREAAAALHLRARLLLAARQHDLRSLGRPRAPRTRPRAGPRASRGGCALRLLRAGFVQCDGARVCRAVGPQARARVDPQPLRRPHVHQSDAGRAQRQGEDQVQPRARGTAGQARRRGR